MHDIKAAPFLSFDQEGGKVILPNVPAISKFFFLFRIFHFIVDA